jgi:hypothetical protein
MKNRDEKKLAEMAFENSGLPHLRDVLKREYNESRPRNYALEKWGPAIEADIMREIKRVEDQKTTGAKKPQPAKGSRMDGPDMDI